MTTPNEHSFHSPAPDPGRPPLDGMSPAWKAVYDRLREAHAAAVLDDIDAPQEPEAQAIVRAAAAAVAAFRQAYEQNSVQAIARQISGE